MTNLLLTLAFPANLIIATNNVAFETNVYETTYEPGKPYGYQGALRPDLVDLAGTLYITNGITNSSRITFYDRVHVDPQKKWITSNVFRIHTFDFEWNGAKRRITDRDVVTNSVRVFRIKEQWEEVK